MSSTDFDMTADPLESEPAAERVNYATGLMLDATDFRDEQTYHRGRLAMLAKYMFGHGTLAGLAVIAPDAEDGELELRIEPGVALDRRGRLIEIKTPQCIRLARWFDDRDDSELLAAMHSGVGVPVANAVIADIFLSAHSCSRGKTPAFATGPYDALDAVVPSRLAETNSLDLVLRKESPAGKIPKPQNQWPGAEKSEEKRLQAVLGSWDSGSIFAEQDGLSALAEHVGGHDSSAVFLARIFIPVSPPAASKRRPRLKLTQRVTVDNSPRPFIYLPGKWFGREPEAVKLVQP